MERVIRSSPYAFIYILRLGPALTTHMGQFHHCNLTLSSNKWKGLSKKSRAPRMLIEKTALRMENHVFKEFQPRGSIKIMLKLVVKSD